MPQSFLYMVLVGCKPAGRHTEQHDVFFGIGTCMRDIIPQLKKFWPGVSGSLHVDAWRRVTQVDEYLISITGPKANDSKQKLYFLNLGGYKPAEFEEFHYKMLAVAGSLPQAKQQAYRTAFYKHTGFAEAPSHIDDKYSVDVDDVLEVKSALAPALQMEYSISIEKGNNSEDEIHLGFFRLREVDVWGDKPAI